MKNCRQKINECTKRAGGSYSNTATNAAATNDGLHVELADAPENWKFKQQQIIGKNAKNRKTEKKRKKCLKNGKLKLQ